LGDLFHDDAAFVNVNGMYAHSRHEIQRHHEMVHAGFFRNSTLDIQGVRVLRAHDPLIDGQ
jgi:uncharacterized protein (TIGR02246 family)